MMWKNKNPHVYDKSNEGKLIEEYRKFVEKETNRVGGEPWRTVLPQPRNPMNDFPPWLFDYNLTSQRTTISRMGILWVRITGGGQPEPYKYDGDKIDGIFKHRGIEYLNITDTDDHTVVVIKVGGKVVVLEDDKDLFPSDTLIGKLAVLGG